MDFDGEEEDDCPILVPVSEPAKDSKKVPGKKNSTT